MITAMKLSFGFLSTIAMIAGGCVLYALTFRWFAMKQRKLALAEAIERRRARQEAAALEEPQERPQEVVTVDPEDEEELDLESIAGQTRSLLRLVFSIAVAVAILVIVGVFLTKFLFGSIKKIVVLAALAFLVILLILLGTAGA